ncbi:DUF1656 domain-containing protein [Acetobacter sp. DsW_063]|uniref:DUF1656 domain-containing protein n=1 Tax=Acetobacter sp. DsW_063 TaxID=1514894 RepID=UPI000A388366|nr:DUF1656 domain-containing protein [Acetobacter sp. DsW_063]OUJ15285.1 hypothetical protein HK28_08660 [Acetobacter sp. DsW_063]
MEIPSVLDVDGLLVSSFLLHVGLAVMTMLALRPLIAKTRLERFVWNIPLAEFGLLIILTGVYSLAL